MRGLVIGGVALLALAGCKTTAQRAAEDDGFCQSIGARVRSDSYVQCRLAQQQRRDAKQAAFEQEMSDYRRTLAIQNANRNLNCTSRRGPFDSVETSCN
jgi:hypothetical protein